MESEIKKLYLFNIPNKKRNKKKEYVSKIIIIINFSSFLIFIFYIQFQNQKILSETKNYFSEKPNNNMTFDKLNFLKIITNNNPLIYKGYENCLENDPDIQRCIYHLIIPKKVVSKNRILIGEKEDGCYVILDDFENIKIAYSFGIADRIQFDHELAKRGIDVYMYDHTINSLPYDHPKFHWYKIGLAGKNNSDPQLKTLEQIILENGHSSEFNMIFKSILKTVNGIH